MRCAMVRVFAVCLLLTGPAVGWAQSAGDWTWLAAEKVGLVEGKGWTATAETYSRLPASAEAAVPASVWGLARHSAGVSVRFRTAAPRIAVRWSLTSDGLAMPHMPATGVSGIDLYRLRGGRWVFVQNGRPAARDGNVAVFSTPGGSVTEYRLYLPLYNGVTSLEIGVPADRAPDLAPGTPPRERPIVYYGTSIAQGGCASRPGMAHVTILGRMLGREMVNLGFSGSGRMEPAVSALIAEVAASAYVIDCLWNMGGLPEDEITARVKSLVAVIRKAHPRTPIVFVAQSHIDPGQHPTRLSVVQRKAVEDLRERGFVGLYLVDGARLVGSDGDGTVDACHPNDLGMSRQAIALAPALRSVLR